MGCRVFGRLIAALVALACSALFAAAPASAAPRPDPHEGTGFCAAYTDLQADPVAEYRAVRQWRCGRQGLTIKPERALLRFDLEQQRFKGTPRVFVTRRSPFERLHLMAVDTDGSVRTLSFGYGDVRPAHTDDFIIAPLPPITASTRYIVASVDRPTQVMTLTRALVSPGDPGFGPDNRDLLLGLAALCGLLVMPLMFNVAFYRVLREKFLVWHSVLVAGLLLTILLSSGLMVYFVPLTVPQMSVVSGLVFGLNVAAAGMFARNFIEPDKLDPRLRRLLLLGAAWAMLVSALHSTFPFAFRAWQSDLYYLAYVPLLALLCAVQVDALRRASRAATFQLVGWLPLLAVGLVRELGQFTPWVQPTDAMGLFYLGCVVEVLATTAGVADRFLALKNQRDTALAEARLMEDLSERDALTGLLNRRMIENHFPVLRAEGFTTLAVIDLDHFKAVNDTFGHAVGDEVLRAVAEALQPDDDTLAVRLGGEEFLLLLRGRSAMQRAEQRRQAIPQLVSGRTEIGHVVTASMGLVEAPRDPRSGLDFDALYHRADILLYEAKLAGRNRTVSERLQAFVPRDGDRRRSAA